MKPLILLFFFAFTPTIALSQSNSVDNFDPQLLNWFNLDQQADEVLGSSIDKSYTYLEQEEDMESKTITVAVIDSGIDTVHEDLKGKIWINRDEIPNNGIDDDENGYIDDINGWNFIGNSKGENVLYENLEYTRIVRMNDPSVPSFEDAKDLHKTESLKRQEEKQSILRFEKAYSKAKSIIKSKTGVTVESGEDLAEVKSTDPEVENAKKFLQSRFSAGFSEKVLARLIETNNEYLSYFLNTDFDTRTLVGDDPLDITMRDYGNPDVKGPRSNHGTSVAGIIAAKRNNDIGINGIATNVEIMCIRSTPRGDERDKDVALAVYYAVDNGADIINMSFGKSFSPQKKFVDDAVKYAQEKGVLIVHSSGNSGENIDKKESFPSDRYLDGSEASNMINVGASSLKLDKDVAAKFSNYGEKHVDIFAPGVDIISTDSSSTYSMNSGTSLSGPVVTGIAALVLSYYPDLTPEELIDILLVSSLKVEKPRKVWQPDLASQKRKKTKFSKLSKSGGIVNAYNALLEAEKRSNL